MQKAHSFLSQLPSLPPNPAGAAHGSLPWGLDLALVVVWLILSVGTCAALTIAWEVVTTATRWLVRIIGQRISKEMDHE